MRRRVLIAVAATAVVGVAATFLPMSSHAQQQTMRTIGYLSSRSLATEQGLDWFRQGLIDAGFVEGQNLTIEYRWGDGQYDRLPTLAADLVRRKVAVIVTIGGPDPARAALGATQTIPIIFGSGSDPVADGLVKSINRPGGNITGVSVFTTSLGPKRLGLLRGLAPRARLIAFLVNPTSPIAEMQVRAVSEAARSVGQEIIVLDASTESGIDAAFATINQRGRRLSS